MLKVCFVARLVDYFSVLLPVYKRIGRECTAVKFIGTATQAPRDADIYVFCAPSSFRDFLRSTTRKGDLVAKGFRIFRKFGVHKTLRAKLSRSLKPIDKRYTSALAETFKTPFFWLPHSVGGDSCEQCQRYMMNLLPGEFFRRKFNIIPQQKTRLVGYPKLDVLFSAERRQIADRVAQGLKLPYEKTVLYSPTGELLQTKQRYRFDSFNLSILRILRIAQHNKLNLIIKVKAGADWLEQETFKTAYAKTKSWRNVNWILEWDNIATLYLLADLLVSDGSSTIREFYATGNPSLQLTNFPNKSFVFPEARHTNLETLEKDVMEALNHPSKFVMPKQMIEDFFYKLDGKSTDRAVKEILHRK